MPVLKQGAPAGRGYSELGKWLDESCAVSAANRHRALSGGIFRRGQV